MVANRRIAVNVNLSPEFEALIQKTVDSGRYASASEVIEQALLLLDRAEREEQLGREIQIGLDQIERGEVIPYGPDFWVRVERMADELKESGDPYDAAVVPPDFVFDEGGPRPGSDTEVHARKVGRRAS